MYIYIYIFYMTYIYHRSGAPWGPQLCEGEKKCSRQSRGISLEKTIMEPEEGGAFKMYFDWLFKCILIFCLKVFWLLAKMLARVPARPVPARPVPTRPVLARPVLARPVPARPELARLVYSKKCYVTCVCFDVHCNLIVSRNYRLPPSLGSGAI